MVTNTTPQKLEHLAQLVDDGAVKPAVDGVFTLDHVNEVFDRVSARGKTGRVVQNFDA